MSPVRPALEPRLAQRVDARRQAGLLRQRQALHWLDATHAEVGGQSLSVFCSNDYLGLAREPALIEAIARSAQRDGVGSTASQLICGHHREHVALEEELAEWTGRERALLFSTGYMANLGVIQALLQRGDLCVQDKLNHASLLDGAQLAGATLKRYPHADAEGAARQLASQPEAAALLVSDGVFSMDGDIAPLAQLAELGHAQRAVLLIDDAHGLGVLGPRGAGCVAEARLDQTQVPLLVGTLGKALGTAGAFVAGPAALIDGIAQFARTHIYTTAAPPALAAATRAALRIARDDAARRERLIALITRFRHGATQLGLPLLSSRTPIQPLLLGSVEAASDAALALRQRGFLVSAIRPPTVPVGQARLRITLSAAHSEAQIDQLLQALDDSLFPIAQRPRQT
jgi:8-amino-7-oxononanoate synthase